MKTIFIKLGGSLITEKDKPLTARHDAIKNIVDDIADSIQSYPEIQFILGNGAGSFGHYLVQKYNLKDGISSEDQWLGVCEVQDAVAQLNRIVVKAFLEKKVPVCSIQPSAILSSEDGQKKDVYLESMKLILKKGLIPIMYGDIILDTKRGCKIFSTEDLFEICMEDIRADIVIHLTQVQGVLDEKEQVISEITESNWSTKQKNIYAPKGFDITGGMKHKIESALLYAKKGVETYIANGETKGMVSKILSGEKASYTKIRSI